MSPAFPSLPPSHGVAFFGRTWRRWWSDRGPTRAATRFRRVLVIPSDRLMSSLLQGDEETDVDKPEKEPRKASPKETGDGISINLDPNVE